MGNPKRFNMNQIGSQPVLRFRIRGGGPDIYKSLDSTGFLGNVAMPDLDCKVSRMYLSFSTSG